ncbi:DUF2382 domain-containing protein [Chamaesiphon sp. GL140_3_metabinner_50]|uniref:DUF2382 domain-containing protein n=1 Tax=Chamaesiphon sp. GL140_3_metabinner_50 TaxID=2970812 RepID=UPI0025CD216E|nr:DUF2382 domain-containing protein [Chamaesiphon sp. GL140_3_metabinner_50]
MLADEFKSSQQNGEVARREQIAAPANIVMETVIPLLEERLVVDLTRRKSGDIVVRKEIETHLLQVQVPIRREKLIVEQVSPEYKLIAEINLDEERVTDELIAKTIAPNDKSIAVSLVASDRSTIDNRHTYSPQGAIDLLNELKNLPDRDSEYLKIEIICQNPDRRDNYQAMLALHSQT